MAAQDHLDRWLDTALNEYSNAEAPLGFELRTIARLRDQRSAKYRSRAFRLAAALTVAIAVVLALRWSHAPIASPPLVQARIVVPAIEKVSFISPAPKARRNAAHESVRGVPIVATPLTPQEEAILRVGRNAHARQLAFAPPVRRDLTQPQDPLDIQELDISPVGKEE
ncbi:MAG TPA: hypothetical protein VGL89_16485 [Candidatus Koribacter sp.]|jgi:hypothetical protein